MAGNGGIIGPPNTVGCASTQPERVTTFTASSCTVTTKAKTTEIDYLVVAGGGTGSDMGGGGGGGGYRTSFPGGTKLTVTGCTSYAVTIGAGGAHTIPGTSPGTPGSNSVFNPGGSEGTTMITGTGGSGGVQVYQPAPLKPAPGGSGGGGIYNCGTPHCAPLGNAGSYTPVEGYPGGPIISMSPACKWGGSGGGGAGGAGVVNADPGGPGGPTGGTIAGRGGVGRTSCISGSPLSKGGGGGGGSYLGTGGAASPCGSSSAGGGAPGAGTSAGANTGGGSGSVGNSPAGSGWSPATNNGGSGIIIIKEPQVCIEAPAPGVWSMNTVYDYVKRGKWV